MRRSMYTLAVFGLLLLSLSLFSRSEAQSDDAACTALVQKAFTALEQNCSALDGNTACYGFSAVDGTFADGASLSKPGDKISLSSIQMLHTSELNSQSEQWGLATLNVPGNVPRSVSSQGIRFVLLGDVQITNTVKPEDVFQPVDPISVKSITGANLRASATTDGRVIGSAPVGTALQADGVSADGKWLRVMTPDNTVAWISRQVVAPAPGSDLTILPVIKPTSRTPMQAFQLKTGFTSNGCAAAPPPTLVIQGPTNMTAIITVNGADIRISSTIALRIMPNGQMQLFVLSGSAVAGNLTVPAGFTMTVKLTTDGTGIDGNWYGLRPITDDERGSLTPLENIPTNLLAYGIKIPTAEEVAKLQSELNSAVASGPAASGPAAGNVECATFRPTSPLQGFPGQVNFYWDPAKGATSYVLNVYGDNGALINSYQTDAISTTIPVNTSGFGQNVSWEVQALYNGQVACTTSRITISRQAGSETVGNGDAGAPPPPPKCTWC